MSSLIHALDVQQSNPATGRVCQNNPEHGRLGVHVSGTMLMCGKCDYIEAANDPRS